MVWIAASNVKNFLAEDIQCIDTYCLISFSMFFFFNYSANDFFKMEIISISNRAGEISRASFTINDQLTSFNNLLTLGEHKFTIFVYFVTFLFLYG